MTSAIYIWNAIVCFDLLALSINIHCGITPIYDIPLKRRQELTLNWHLVNVLQKTMQIYITHNVRNTV